MFIWAPLTYLLASIAIYIYLKKPKQTVPVFINGLIPSLKGAKEKSKKGTTVYVFYQDTIHDNTPSEIFNGYANEEGKVEVAIPIKNIGRRVEVRIRHSGFKFEEFDAEITAMGMIYSAKMELDSVDQIKYRGREVADLKQHYQDARDEADNKRIDAIDKIRATSRKWAQIPTLFWLASYLVVIIAFAFDYLANGEMFCEPISSLVNALYFSVVTITTLGYGDFYPEHNFAKYACSAQAITGVLLIGLYLNSLFYERSKS